MGESEMPSGRGVYWRSWEDVESWYRTVLTPPWAVAAAVFTFQRDGGGDGEEDGQVFASQTVCRGSSETRNTRLPVDLWICKVNHGLIHDVQKQPEQARQADTSPGGEQGVLLRICLAGAFSTITMPNPSVKATSHSQPPSHSQPSPHFPSVYNHLKTPHSHLISAIWNSGQGV